MKLKEVETINLIFQKLDQATTSQDLFKILVNLSGKITPCDEAHFYFFTQGMKDYQIICSFFRDKKRENSDAVYIEENIVKKVDFNDILANDASS